MRQHLAVLAVAAVLLLAVSSVAQSCDGIIPIDPNCSTCNETSCIKCKDDFTLIFIADMAEVGLKFRVGR